jgi:hypothetical protein
MKRPSGLIHKDDYDDEGKVVPVPKHKDDIPREINPSTNWIRGGVGRRVDLETATKG